MQTTCLAVLVRYNQCGRRRRYGCRRRGNTIDLGANDSVSDTCLVGWKRYIKYRYDRKPQRRHGWRHPCAWGSTDSMDILECRYSSVENIIASPKRVMQMIILPLSTGFYANVSCDFDSTSFGRCCDIWIRYQRWCR